MTEKRPEQIAASLTQEQQNYLCGKRRIGSPRGLVRRGLLAYAWGFDSRMGYKDTALGIAVRDAIERGAA